MHHVSCSTVYGGAGTCPVPRGDVASETTRPRGATAHTYGPTTPHSDARAAYLYTRAAYHHTCTSYGHTCAAYVHTCAAHGDAGCAHADAGGGCGDGHANT